MGGGTNTTAIPWGLPGLTTSVRASQDDDHDHDDHDDHDDDDDDADAAAADDDDDSDIFFEPYETLQETLMTALLIPYVEAT